MSIDIALVKAAQNGDKESFAKVYDYYAKDLYRVALYTLHNSFDAEDVVSETFVEAYRGIKNVREPEKIKSWMMRILSIRCKRKIGEYVRSRGEADFEECAYNIADESDIALESIQRQDIAQALTKLSPEEREIIALATVQGYTAKEVAQILQSPQGTVSSKLYRALAKLRQILGDQEL